jgi:hypothetical protein
MLFLFPLALFSQQNNDTLVLLPPGIVVIQPQVHVGKLVKIYPDFPSSAFVNFNEVNFALQTRGKKEWHELYGYPQIGLSFIYGYWSNNAVLGQNYAIVPNIAFEKHSNKKIKFQTRLGFGFTYFTQHFDVIDNPTNNVIGARITNITFLSEDLNYQLNKSLKINVGISAFHSSDGHYQLPNLGANVPSVNVGLSYLCSPATNFYKHDSIRKPNKKWVLNFFVGYGRHEFGSSTKPTGGPKYPVFHGAIFATKRYKKISSFQTGLSYSYYTDYYDYIINQEVFNSKQHLKASVITAFLGNEFIIGKFGLIAQSGINFYTPFLEKINQSNNVKNYTSIYISNKIGIQYYFLNPTDKPKYNAYIGLYMKANFGTADYAQIGVGSTF